MELLPTLLSSPPYLELPQGLLGWGGWIALLALAALIQWKLRGQNKSPSRSLFILFIVLLAAVPLTSLFVGLRLPLRPGMTPPEMPFEARTPSAMLFSALPWMLAGGFLGPLAAAILALLSGLLRALWDTHSLFTPLEAVLLATAFSAAVNQRFRTPFFRLLSRPLASAALTTILYPFLSMVVTIFSAHGVVVSRVDYALNQLRSVTVVHTLMLILAGLFTEVIAVAAARRWGGKGKLTPSPAERSLQARFLYYMAPLALGLVLLLVVGDWIVAGNAAKKMLEARMANAAGVAADNVPFFLQTGQSLIEQLATGSRLVDTPAEQLSDVLSKDLRAMPYFSQLYVLDENGNSLSGYPQQSYLRSQAPLEEQIGINLAKEGNIPVQTYSIAPDAEQHTARVSFIAALFDGQRQVRGILIGQSILSTNPLTQPIINSLNNLEREGGQGLLIDESQRILYHPDPNQIMTSYTGRMDDEALFYEDTSPDGTRRLVYAQRAAGSPWAVVLYLPASRAQSLALEIALPLLAIILVLTMISALVLSFSLNRITGSLKNLASEAGRITEGELDHPLLTHGEDEVGQLRRSFEGMRVSLKARLEELNRLLQVSQGVASSLEVSEAIRPILDSALAMGASSARVVLSPAMMPELDGGSPQAIGYGAGLHNETFRALDEQILASTLHQERLILYNPTRPRLFNLPPGSPRPESLLALALQHENQFFGALWVAYDHAHTFSDEEVRFLATLAGQAALAAANARLFLNAEIGRQRLAAILASTPDPVLVTDQHNCLLLSNPAAWQALGVGIESDEGQPIERAIQQKELLELLKASSEKQSREVTLADGRVYLATASSVLAEGRRMGRVCLLRDITYFKELDAMKSDFVSTVSHDLRSPLTLMRGYATMLDMVGQVNEQQTGYIRKILTGVEDMSRLVNNLLDLGRIDAGVGLQAEKISIHDIIERVVNALQIQAIQKRIQVTIEIAPGTDPLIEADRALFQQALQNLVENAIKYTRNEGKVDVRASSRQEWMVVEVQDNGMGISPMDLARLGEKFYRGAQQSSKEQRGSGLGLAIVKSIVERHGGEIRVDSQLGKGSTFTLILPLRQEQVATRVEG